MLYASPLKDALTNDVADDVDTGVFADEANVFADEADDNVWAGELACVMACVLAFASACVLAGAFACVLAGAFACVLAGALAFSVEADTLVADDVESRAPRVLELVELTNEDVAEAEVKRKDVAAGGREDAVRG